MIFRLIHFEIKNSIRLIRKSLLGIILFVAMLTVVITAVSFIINKNSIIQPIKVAIVMDEEDSLSRMLLSYISKTDSIESISTLSYMTRDEAFDSLTAKESNIIIDVPDDFFNDVNNGINTPVNIYISQDADKITEYFAILLKCATSYVRTSEASIYSFISIKNSGDYEVKLKEKSVGDYMAEVYAKIILAREKIYDTKIISRYGNTGQINYYISAVLIIVQIIFSLSLIGLYKNNTPGFEQTLRLYDINSFDLYYIKKSITAIYCFGVSLITYLLIYITGKAINLQVVEIKPIHFLIMLITSVVIATFINMLIYLLGNNYNSICIIYMISLLLLLTSGMLIPATDKYSIIYYINPVYLIGEFTVSGMWIGFKFSSLIYVSLIYVISDITVLAISRYIEV